MTRITEKAPYLGTILSTPFKYSSTPSEHGLVVEHVGLGLELVANSSFFFFGKFRGSLAAKDEPTDQHIFP